MLRAEIGLPAAIATFAKQNGIDLLTQPEEAVTSQKAFKYHALKLTVEIGVADEEQQQVRYDVQPYTRVSVFNVPRPNESLQAVRPTDGDLGVVLEVRPLSPALLS